MKLNSFICVVFKTVLFISSSNFIKGQFTNSTNNSATRIEPVCERGASCKEKCTKEIQYAFVEPEPLCHCDPLCAEFDDCCADYERMCKLVEEDETAVHIKRNTSQSTEQQPKFQCITFETSKNRPGVWMVTSCPSGWSKHDNIKVP